jgi:hypothetical protein
MTEFIRPTSEDEFDGWYHPRFLAEYHNNESALEVDKDLWVKPDASGFVIVRQPDGAFSIEESYSDDWGAQCFRSVGLEPTLEEAMKAAEGLK